MSPSATIQSVLAIRPKGLIKLAAIDPHCTSAPRVKCFEMPSQSGDACAWVKRYDGKLNLYFEPNPARHKADRRSKESDIVAAAFAYVDCDPVGKETPAEAQARHRERLASGVVPPPTFAYASGGGLVAMWKFNKPISLDSPAAVATVKNINVDLAKALGGKEAGYDNCQSLEHLYRLPGTVNIPTAAKVAKGRTRVRAGEIACATGPRYKPTELLCEQPSKTGNDSRRHPTNLQRLSELNVPDRIKTIIEFGSVPGEKKEKDNTRSAWRCEAVMGMLQEGVADSVILRFLLDPIFKISARALEQGPRAEQYARAEIARLKKLVAKSIADDFDGASFEPSDEGDGGSVKGSIVLQPSPYCHIDPSKIPPRKWIYKDSYIRKFMGLTTATGGAGKSSLLLVEAIAMATGRALLGVQPSERARVWYWNGEDPQEELQRRVAAVLMYYGISAAEIEGWLFLDSGRDMPIKTAETRQGNTTVVTPVKAALVQAIQDNRIDVLIIDPFVSSHSVSENDNTAIELVAKAWADIANVTGCAVQISHHTRKTNGESASVEDARGASSLNYAARTRRAINRMTQKEAEKAGIKGNGQRYYFRGDNANSSMTPPTESLNWFRFESVQLGNGDSVGVVVKYDYPEGAVDLTDDERQIAVAALGDGGPWRANHQSANGWAGVAMAQALGLDITEKATSRKMIELIKLLIDDGSIEVFEAQDETRNKRKFLRPTDEFG